MLNCVFKNDFRKFEQLIVGKINKIVASGCQLFGLK